MITGLPLKGKFMDDFTQWFIGQAQIKKQIQSTYIPLLRKGKNFNFIMKASTGMGKTRLACDIVNSVCDPDSEAWLILPDDEGKVDVENFDRRFIILDEIHTLKTQELLYPYLDRGDRTFILCSNESGKLLEPLQNRCIPFIFVPYTERDMTQIIMDYARQLNFCDFDQYSLVVKAGSLNPRVTKGILKSLADYREAGNSLPNTPQAVDNMIKTILNIEDGLNSLQRRYLEFLRVHESASLDLISYVLRIDKLTVRRDVEPVLVERGLIGIGARGRFIRQL